MSLTMACPTCATEAGYRAAVLEYIQALEKVVEAAERIDDGCACGNHVRLRDAVRDAIDLSAGIYGEKETP